MKRIVSLLLIFLFVLTTATGCSFLDFGEDKVLSDVKPYRIMNKQDRSLLSAKRVEFAVYVEDASASTDALRKYTNEIVKQYQDKYKGIMVSFYDIQEETASFNNIPFAVGIWAPKGNFKNALIYEDFQEKQYTTVVKKNKQVYKPTEEERALYIRYLQTDKKIEEFLKEEKISDEGINDFTNLMHAMKHRYEEVVER